MDMPVCTSVDESKDVADRDKMNGQVQIHPAAQRFPGMHKARFEALAKDIQQKKQILPILTHNGKVLDGRCRLEACKQLGIPAKTQALDPEYSAEEYSVSLNLLRRDLTADQRAIIVAQYELPSIEAEAKERQREAGRNCGRGQQRKVPAGLAEPIYGEAREIASKRYGVSRKHISDAKLVCENNPKFAEEVRYGEKKLSYAAAIVRKGLRDGDNARLAKQIKLPKDVEIYHGDCWKLSQEIAENSIDAIATDPFYAEFALGDWETLAKIAARVLKPGGYCISYSGKMYLDQVISILAKHLTWYWQICLTHKGHANIFHARNAIEMHKPILIFCKPPIRKTEKAFPDLVEGTGREKDWHDYQQAEAELYNLLAYFVKPQQIILDPFAGGGTTLVVARDLKCRGIGYEIDINNVNAIKIRLAEKMGQQKQAQQW